MGAECQSGSDRAGGLQRAQVRRGSSEATSLAGGFKTTPLKSGASPPYAVLRGHGSAPPLRFARIDAFLVAPITTLDPQDKGAHGPSATPA